jgi:uncharacterized protein involved in propanediol utilization
MTLDGVSDDCCDVCLTQSDARTKTGFGTCVGHHGEILQGVFRDGRGELRRGLVTMPCVGISSRASFAPFPHSPVTVSPPDRVKALTAVKMALLEIGKPDWGGTLTLTSTITPGLGLGSSTADVVAGIRAVASAFRVEMSAATIARLAVRAEIASDSIMYEGCALLFAQRDALVLERFAAPLPTLIAVGVDTAPGRMIETLKLPPLKIDDRRVSAYAVLRGLLRRAIATGDASLLARVATESARLNQDIVPITRFDDLLAIADRAGAAGIQVAHSGTVAALLFDARDPASPRKVGQAPGILKSEGFTLGLSFRT